MTCPESVAAVVLKIIRQSILEARMAGWEGDAELCAVLMDHIHNLPDLLSDYSEERLAYYWEAERPLFIERVPADISKGYTELWDELQKSGQLHNDVIDMSPQVLTPTVAHTTRNDQTRPRLFADFQNADPQGRIRLNVCGTLHDLHRQHVSLCNGLKVTLYSEDVETDAEVCFSDDENLWTAIVDWDEIRQFDDVELPAGADDEGR